GAPAVVEIGNHENGREGDQRRFRKQLARHADAVTLGHQVGRQPQQEAEVYEAEANRGEAEGEELPDEGATGQLGGLAALRLTRFVNERGPRRRTETFHDAARLFPSPPREQELCGLRYEGPKNNEREPRW